MKTQVALSGTNIMMMLVIGQLVGHSLDGHIRFHMYVLTNYPFDSLISTQIGLSSVIGTDFGPNLRCFPLRKLFPSVSVCHQRSFLRLFPTLGLLN